MNFQVNLCFIHAFSTFTSVNRHQVISIDYFDKKILELDVHLRNYTIVYPVCVLSCLFFFLVQN